MRKTIQKRGGLGDAKIESNRQPARTQRLFNKPPRMGVVKGEPEELVSFKVWEKMKWPPVEKTSR